MPKSKYLFSRKIKCLDCGNNYRGISDRKFLKYICGGYARKISSCQRNAIEEKELVRLIEAYCVKNRIEFRMDKEFINKLIKRIEISKEKIKIIYKNGNESIISGNMYKI